MQEAGESTVIGRGPISPIKAFVVLAAIAATITAVVVLTRAEPTPPSTRTATPSAIPTEAEAIAIFEDLHELWLRSYTERDATLLKLYAAPDAPTLGKPDEIKQLINDGVLYETSWVRKNLSVLRRSHDELVLRETTLRIPRFTDEATGEDITTGKAEIQLVEWTVRSYADGWLLYRSVIMDVQPA